MEPLAPTDGSVGASGDHLAQRWRPERVAATRALAPPMLRWGGLLSAYYRWREGVGPRSARTPMHNLMWGGVETSQIGTDEAEPLMCVNRSEEHTSELQSLMRISYAVFCLYYKSLFFFFFSFFFSF